MSTATNVETAGRTSLGWMVAVVGTGLMITALILGLLLQRGEETDVPSRAAVRDATELEPTADYGIRHLQRSEAPALEATADYGTRHLRQIAPTLSTDVDHGISHQGVRPFDYRDARMNALDISRGRRADTDRLEAAVDFYRSLGQRR